MYLKKWTQKQYKLVHILQYIDIIAYIMYYYMSVDELDLAILNLLRQDGRMTVKDISDQLDRRRATVHNRIAKMEENGTIKGYTVIPDFSKLGFHITVYILAAVHQQTFEGAEQPESISAQISKIPYITEVHNITGEWDYLIKARVRDLEAMGREINFRLLKEFGISRTQTLAAFSSDLEELSNFNFNLFRYIQTD